MMSTAEVWVRGRGRGRDLQPSITQCAIVMSTAEVWVRGRGGRGERDLQPSITQCWLNTCNAIVKSTAEVWVEGGEGGGGERSAAFHHTMLAEHLQCYSEEHS